MPGGSEETGQKEGRGRGARRKESKGEGGSCCCARLVGGSDWIGLDLAMAGRGGWARHRHRRCHRHHQGTRRPQRKTSRPRVHACEHHVTEQFHSVWTHPRAFPLADCLQRQSGCCKPHRTVGFMMRGVRPGDWKVWYTRPYSVDPSSERGVAAPVLRYTAVSNRSTPLLSLLVSEP